MKTKSILSKYLLTLTLFLFTILPLTTSAISFPTQIDTLQERINIQVVLNRVMIPSPNLVVDGVLGRKSIQAIQAFQESRGLVPDGKVGPITRSALETSQTGTTTSTTTINNSNGCVSGAIYNAMTGELCTKSITSLPTGCTSSTKYSPITGVYCGNTTATTTTNNTSGAGGGSTTNTSTNYCTGSSFRSCTISNGTGNQSRTCNSGYWSSYGNCAPNSCNSGYQVSNSTCVAVNCTGSSTQSCPITNGSGTQSRTCSSGTWSSYNTCTVSTCNTGYQISGNSCVSNTVIDSQQITKILANGFENNGTLTLPFTSITNNGSISIDSSTYYKGSRSLKLQGYGSYYYTNPDLGTDGIISSISDSDVINYSVYVKGESSSQAGMLITCLGNQLNYWEGSNGYSGTEFATSTSWEKKTVSYTCPSWAKYVGVRLSVRGSGKVWYDDPVVEILKSSLPVCAPESSSTTCSGKCGTQTNNCGTSVNCTACVSTPPTGDFTIYKSWDFENRSVGTYTEAMADEDFVIYQKWLHGNESLVVTDNINGIQTKVIKSVIPSNSDPFRGFQINTYLDNAHTSYKELYLSYNIKLGGHVTSENLRCKIPGLRGLPGVDNLQPLPTNQGFICHPMITGGKPFTYHYDRTTLRGANDCKYDPPFLPWGCNGFDFNEINFAPDKWYSVTQRVVTNSFTNGIPNSDGIYEVWVDGKLIFQEDYLKILGDETKGIDGVSMSAYCNDVPDVTTDIKMDNFIVWVNKNDSTYGTRNVHDSTIIVNTPNE